MDTDVDSNPTGLIEARQRLRLHRLGWQRPHLHPPGRPDDRHLRPGADDPAWSPLPVGFPADAVPTDVVVGPDGARYVSQLVGFPFEQGASTIWRVPRGGDPEPYATGLTNVTSLAFAKDGTLYAVEIAANGLLSAPPGTLPVGALVKVQPGASEHPVVAGDLPAPYGLAIRRGSAYVTTDTFTPGGGKVVKIHL